MESNNITRVSYIVLSIAWLMILLYVRVRITNLIIAIICILPPIVMAISFNYIGEIDEKTEDNIVNDNYVSIYILVSLPILAYLNFITKDKKDLIEVNVIAILLIMLSTIDVWIPKEGLTVVRHIKTTLQTMAISLFVYSFYSMYLEEGHLGTSSRPLIPPLEGPNHDLL